MWKNFRNAFNETCAVENSCSEGEENIAWPARPKKGKSRGFAHSPQTIYYNHYNTTITTQTAAILKVAMDCL